MIKPPEKRKILFNHTGNMGDLFYAFPFMAEMRDFLHAEMKLHIQTNVVFDYKFEHPNGNVGFTQKNAEFMLPLLKAVKMFDEVTYGDSIPEEPKEKVDLSMFRRLPINFQAGNCQNWYYNLTHVHLPHDFITPRISVEPDYALKNKILIAQSSRYNNMFIDLRCIKELKDKLVFIGLEKEHKEFEEKAFKIDFFKVEDALHFAKVLQGSLGFVANQTGLFAIAEQMKVPRILIAPEFMLFEDKMCPGPHNVIPTGGWFEVAEVSTKLMSSLKNMLFI